MKNLLLVAFLFLITNHVICQPNYLGMNVTSIKKSRTNTERLVRIENWYNTNTGVLNLSGANDYFYKSHKPTIQYFGDNFTAYGNNFDPIEPYAKYDSLPMDIGKYSLNLYDANNRILETSVLKKYGNVMKFDKSTRYRYKSTNTFEMADTIIGYESPFGGAPMVRTFSSLYFPISNENYSKAIFYEQDTNFVAYPITMRKSYNSFGKVDSIISSATDPFGNSFYEYVIFSYNANRLISVKNYAQAINPDSLKFNSTHNYYGANFDSIVSHNYNYNSSTQTNDLRTIYYRKLNSQGFTDILYYFENDIRYNHVYDFYGKRIFTYDTANNLTRHEFLKCNTLFTVDTPTNEIIYKYLPYNISSIKNKVPTIQHLSAYPNPCSNNLQILYSILNNANYTISLYTTDGKLVQQKKNKIFSGNGIIDWNIETIPTGNYILQYTDDANGSSSTSLMVKK